MDQENWLMFDGWKNEMWIIFVEKHVLDFIEKEGRSNGSQLLFYKIKFAQFIAEMEE